jgi:hypothetical protein
LRWFWAVVAGASSPRAEELISVKRIKFMIAREVNENSLPKKPRGRVIVLARKIRIEE